MFAKKIVALIVVAGALGGAPILPASAQPLYDAERGIQTLAPMLENVTPAVVNIAVVSKAPQHTNPLMRDPFFKKFFNMPDQPQARPRMSAGSGVIVDAAKGYVLTNHHVIKGGDAIHVTLKDKRRFKAKLIGSDPGTDIALLQIKADNLTALSFGDSDGLKVGDFVVAIGNPFGLGQTVTSGIVSALGRSGLNIEGYEDFIQTDASINPGNSGGALVDLHGRLVGINTAIIGPSGGNVGIGFAVPSAMVSSVMDQLVAYGEVKRGKLGVVIQDVTPDIAEALSLSHAGGALIAQVEAGSAADKAGLKAGDVIVGVDGQDTENAADLRNQVGLVPVGKPLSVTVMRGGDKQIIQAVVGDAKVSVSGGQIPAIDSAVFSNITQGDKHAVRVDSVAKNSSAWQQGLRQGDIIVAANRRPVDSVKALAAVAKSAEVLALNVMRDGRMIFLVIR